MKYIPIYRVSLVRDSSISHDNYGIATTPGQAAKILSSYLAGADREHFCILMVNTKNRAIGINTVSIGSLNSATVHPREVFKPAIVANATAIILCHNHPSGDTDPSAVDLETTTRLRDAGALLGIDVLDHIILGDLTGSGSAYTSMRERGLF